MIISSSSGLSYGELVDERDGQVYKTVKIGKQIWMAENLNYAYTEPIKVGNTTIDSASFCYNNEPDSCAKYGRLYVWEAAVGCTNENIKSRMTDEKFNSRGICPDNWHIPSIDEWEILIEYTNGLTMDLKTCFGTHMPLEHSLDVQHQCHLIDGYEAVCFSSKELEVLYPEEMENFFAFSVRCVKDSTEAE
jgi:uncharacterized protein (TIGR02145 family)